MPGRPAPLSLRIWIEYVMTSPTSATPAEAIFVSDSEAIPGSAGTAGGIKGGTTGLSPAGLNTTGVGSSDPPVSPGAPGLVPAGSAPESDTSRAIVAPPGDAYVAATATVT